MEYAIVGIIVVAVVTVSVIVFLKVGEKKANENTDVIGGVKTKLQDPPISTGRELEEFTIQMELLPAEESLDESRLVEITDSKVLAHVNNLIPGLVQVGNVVNNAVQAAKTNGEVLYRAIIPKGVELAKSKATKGASRGFYHGKNGVKGHADWMPEVQKNGSAVAANSVAAAMGVAAMVVGQYYMTQINAELGEISDGISKISDFQDNEYRSRVFSLMTNVKRIADFQVEILQNNELRLLKISQLDRLEDECTKLLGQANLTLVDYTKKKDLDYTSYEKELSEAQSWYLYQKSLMDILCKISELRYALHLGTVSREHCVALLHTYTEQAAETQRRLTKWHQDTTERLKIDTSEERRRRSGIDGAIHFLPGLFDDTKNFKMIETKTAKLIATQIAGSIHTFDMSELYTEDVQLISKNGNVYYLPAERTEDDETL